MTSALGARARVARGFDRISPFYDLAASAYLAGAIPRSQVCHLDRACRLAAASRYGALIVGGGTGRFLIALLDAGFSGRVLCLDVSPGMLERTRRLLCAKHPDRKAAVELRLGGVECLDPTERFGLVCTHYFLDLFGGSELPRIMSRLDRAVSDGGCWSYSDFCPPTGPAPLRWVQALQLRALYAFFGAACCIEPRRLPPIRQTFRRLGWHPRVRTRLAGGWLESALYSRRRHPKDGDGIVEARDG